MIDRETPMRTVIITILALFTLAATGNEPMSQKLSTPASVPLDFLDWIERDADWLRESLADLGVDSGYTVSGSTLEATTVEALRAANRIRSFAYLAAPGLRPPYFDLPVKEADGKVVRCVTLFPRSIAPGIDAMDFACEAFSAAEADPAILEMCRVGPKSGGEYQGLDREAFRSRYFDAAGDLEVELVDLNTDPAFIARAIDLGFFVHQQDLTGRLRLGQE